MVKVLRVRMIRVGPRPFDAPMVSGVRVATLGDRGYADGFRLAYSRDQIPEGVAVPL